MRRRVERLGPASLAARFARHPLRVAMVAIIVYALCAAGFARYAVDPGQDLLVGQNSAINQRELQFEKNFGSDPIVLVFAARNPTAFYRTGNVVRFSALEDDLNHDPRVASALGMGTVANSLVNASAQEIQKILLEYPNFVAELKILTGETDQQKIKDAYTAAQTVLEFRVAQAAVDAEKAREQAQSQEAASPNPNDRILDTPELAAESAVQNDLNGPNSILPPYLDAFLDPNILSSSATQQEKDAALSLAKALFVRLTAAYGDCDPQIANFVHNAIPNFQPTCQYLIERAMLNLPACPQISSHLFCQPKPEWAAILPQRSGDIPGQMPADCAAPQAGCSYAILTIRVTPATAADPNQLNSLINKINLELTQGIQKDAYFSSLSSDKQQELLSLHALQPTECGGEAADSGCKAATGDAPLNVNMGGAPLLAFGVADSMQQMILILAPVAVVLMLVLLLVAFRLRGRIWPLAAAIMATLTSFGLSLLWGIRLSPATLAAVPVLVGLGVDYSVQMVARFNEEFAANQNDQKSAENVLRRTAPATGKAALATLVGLGALLLVTGVDAGPLQAVPLVAQFSMVVGVGVVLSWLASIFIALPLSIRSVRNHGPASSATSALRAGTMPLRQSHHVRLILIPAALTALLGWVLLPFTEVQTDTAQLFGKTLPQMQSINTIRDETGYQNEVDAYLTGNVAGPANDVSPTPANVIYQCQLAQQLAQRFPNQVAATTSIANLFMGSVSSQQGTTSEGCGKPAESTAQTSPSSGNPQTTFLCSLRVVPLISRTLMMNIPQNASACPPLDKLQQKFITNDTTPINPDQARIVVAMNSSAVADAATVSDGINSDANPPAGLQVNAAGLEALAASAYDTIKSHALLMNLFPLLIVVLAMRLLMARRRNILLAVLPAALAAGWAPLIVHVLGFLPGEAGRTLGELNPLTVVVGAVVIALATEFSVVMLSRFDDELRTGADIQSAMQNTWAGTGRAVLISAATLAAGFAVLALSGLLPNQLPLLSGFGISVLIDLALAVGAVMFVMFPAAIAWERAAPVELPRAVLKGQRRQQSQHAPVKVKQKIPASAAPAEVSRRERNGHGKGNGNGKPQRDIDVETETTVMDDTPEFTTVREILAPEITPPRRVPHSSGRPPEVRNVAPENPKPEAEIHSYRPSISGRRHLNSTNAEPQSDEPHPRSKRRRPPPWVRHRQNNR